MRNKLAQKIKLGAALLLMAGTSAFAQTSNQIYTPTPENIKARQEFQDNKFGIFLHWGIYSMTAQGEWYMNTHNINRNEYAKLASGFYPSRFDAAEWVSAIKTSGAKYICITSRHHDSFSMFDTKESDFNIVDATPFKRDILKELAEECQKQGIKLHFYYSHLDWFRDDYPEGNTGHGTGRPKGHGNWASYYKFMNKQLTELLTNYGPVGAIWFDGIWDQPTNFNWQLEEQYALIHKLQPSCLIGNNHHRTPYAGEDFQMFERDLPGENKAGFSAGQGISELPLETCETMNGMWGYRIEDQNYKSPKELIHYLVKAAGKNANLANHLNTLGFHILLQLRGGRRGEVIRIPGEFPVIIIAITFPVVIKSIAINRNILGPVQLYHFIELVFVDIPLKVGESQRPLWHHGRCPCDFGEAGHNLLRLSQHDEIFYVFFLVAAALRRRSPIIEFHLAVGGVCIGIAAVRVHQNTISGS